jgi:hypothetical protein
MGLSIEVNEERNMFAGRVVLYAAHVFADFKTLHLIGLW